MVPELLNPKLTCLREPRQTFAASNRIFAPQPVGGKVASMPSPHPLAGQTPTPEMLVDVPKLITAYFTDRPDPGVASQRVAFGTSGHRGSSLRCSFNQRHIMAIAQAICDYRSTRGGARGPLFLAKDTHALSEPAFITAVEVLVANGVQVKIDHDKGYTPTPALSHAILKYNRHRSDELADGIVITPSHNPPQDGGFKYNGTDGGPADAAATRWIEDRANVLLQQLTHPAKDVHEVHHWPRSRAFGAHNLHLHDYLSEYVNDLSSVVDMDAIRDARLNLCADALGGAGVAYWRAYFRSLPPQVDDSARSSGPHLPLHVRGLGRQDPHGLFVAVRHGRADRAQGQVRCGIRLRYRSRPSWNCDAQRRPDESESLPGGGDFVSVREPSRVARRCGRGQDAGVQQHDRSRGRSPGAPRWWKCRWASSGSWKGCFDGSLGFGGEESAGASFLRRDGSVWSTDKDGMIMALLAAEMLARTGKDPGDIYQELTEQFGAPVYERIDAPASPEQKALLLALSPEMVSASELAGDPIERMQTKAPGNGAALGGLKVSTARGWFAARPSGTENVYKLYAESFAGPEHLRAIQSEAQALLTRVLAQ